MSYRCETLSYFYIIPTQDFPENIGSPYLNLVSVEVTRADGSSSVITGSVFGSVPYVVRLDSYVDLLSFKVRTRAGHTLLRIL